MSLVPPEDVTADGPVETLAFDILMESVLKMSRLMNVSVFLLVEQSCGRKRRYGGSPRLCQAFKRGKLSVRRGDDFDEDVQLTLEVEDGRNRSCSSIASPLNYEIIETEETLKDGRGPSQCLPVIDSISSIIEVYPNRAEMSDKASVDSDYQDSDYVVDGFEDFGDDDDSDWSTENRVKNKVVNKKNSPQTKQKPIQRQKTKIIPPSPLSIEQKTRQNRSRENQHPPKEETHLALQVRDYAEGRGEFEPVDTFDFLSEVLGGAGSIDAEGRKISSGRLVEEEVVGSRVKGRFVDAGARNDSSDDDDWKPVNYGKGKLYQRERKRSHRKEMRRKSRMVAEERVGEGSSEADAVTGGGADSISNAVVSAKGDGGLCPHCNRYFHKIKKHMQEVHVSNRQFSCEYCASRFKRDEHLKKHLKSIHKVAG